jgi:hypothetical protein
VRPNLLQCHHRKACWRPYSTALCRKHLGAVDVTPIASGRAPVECRLMSAAYNFEGFADMAITVVLATNASRARCPHSA